MNGRQNWRDAIAAHRKKQRTQRARPKRDPLDTGPGMIRRAPRRQADPDLIGNAEGDKKALEHDKTAARRALLEDAHTESAKRDAARTYPQPAGHTDTAPLKVYLGGPMRGIPEFNFPAFLEAAGQLRASGHLVWSPAERDLENGFNPAGCDGSFTDHAFTRQRFSLREALGEDLAWICAEADAVALLPGWDKSLGAQTERAAALALGLPVMYLGDSGQVLAAPQVPADAPADQEGTCMLLVTVSIYGGGTAAEAADTLRNHSGTWGLGHDREMEITSAVPIAPGLAVPAAPGLASGRKIAGYIVDGKVYHPADVKVMVSGPSGAARVVPVDESDDVW